MVTVLNDVLSFVLGWPLIIYVLAISTICTLAFAFVQFRYFLYAWKVTLLPSKKETQATTTGDMSPLQAFINTLSTNLGNGSIAGMATAVYSGGPGAAIWVLIIGFVLMSVRFAEVYLSTYMSSRTQTKHGLEGPMLYLKNIWGGWILAPLYSIFCLMFTLICPIIQTNSMAISLNSTWNVPFIVSAIIMLLFMIYVLFGGTRRIVALSDMIVPLKVGVFFVSSFIVLGYHYAALIPALTLMAKAAFQPLAFAGGVLGFTVQQAMRFGISRSIIATESGLGTAAILFGATGSKQPAKDGIISMLSTFISSLVCFIIALCIVASGVWDNGLTSTALTISAFQTVFGSMSGWVVTFLSVSFGVGVLVSYTYIVREAWLSVTRNRYRGLFAVVLCLFTFAGPLINATAVFGFADVVSGAMLFINLFGIVYFIPVIRKGLAHFKTQH